MLQMAGTKILSLRVAIFLIHYLVKFKQKRRKTVQKSKKINLVLLSCLIVAPLWGQSLWAADRTYAEGEGGTVQVLKVDGPAIIEVDNIAATKIEPQALPVYKPLYYFSGVADSGNHSSGTWYETTAVHCSNIGGSDVNIRVTFYNWDGTVMGFAEELLSPYETRTKSTQNNKIFGETVIDMDQINQGHALVESDGGNVICTAHVLDGFNVPPTFATTLALHRVKDSPRPTVRGTDREFYFSGVVDDGEKGSSNRREATSFHCTNLGGTAANVELAIYYLTSGSTPIATSSYPINPGETVTVSTQNTDIYYDSITLDTNSIFYQGLAHIKTDSQDVICTGQILDPRFYPPKFAAELTPFNENGYPVGQEPSPAIMFPVSVKKQ